MLLTSAYHSAENAFSSWDSEMTWVSNGTFPHRHIHWTLFCLISGCRANTGIDMPLASAGGLAFRQLWLSESTGFAAFVWLRPACHGERYVMHCPGYLIQNVPTTFSRIIDFKPVRGRTQVTPGARWICP